MAVNYSDLTPGSAVTWKNTGGTKAMLLKNLTNGSIREGDKSATLIDGTMGFPEVLEFSVETKPVSAPTDGTELELRLGFSSSVTAGTDNPGGLTGADAAVSGVGKLQQLVYAGSVVQSNTIGTGVQRQVFRVVPQKEYVIPVIYNNMGVSTSNVDGETVVTMRPWYRRTPVA